MAPGYTAAVIAPACATRAWAADPGMLPLTPATIHTALRAAHQAGALNLPLPGGGKTLRRWQALAELAAADLSLARLAEGHADAVAILAELAGPGGAAAEPTDMWGVWAAEPPGTQIQAVRGVSGWRLTGRKPWCSCARLIDRALITAHAEDGRRLFAVSVADTIAVPGTWSAVGMAASGSLAVDLLDVPAAAVGGPRAYLDRPGFWHGGAGVAACWYGGALGAARTLLGAARRRDVGPHALAHLGAVDAVVTGLAAWLQVAAVQIDDDPHDSTGQAELRARRLRAGAEAGATEVLDRVGRALGAGPLCLDPVHAQRAADLTVYLRQSHAERDLADLGALAARDAVWGAAWDAGW